MKNTERKIRFEDGVFKDTFLKFIEYKQGLGFSYGNAAQSSLSRINSFLNHIGCEYLTLTKEVVMRLASSREGESPATRIKRICYLRHLASFMQEIGYEAYVYPSHYNMVFHDSFTPYIFSREQMKVIIRYADMLSPKVCSPRYHLVWPAFIRVLYGCGLRLSEALNLKIVDVDLVVGVLLIEKSKNGTSRYVPVSHSLKNYLIKYSLAMTFKYHDDTFFFPAPDGGHYAPSTARDRIKGFYKIARIPKLASGNYPRVHDIRHTFCCHTLIKMQELGHDLYYALPILSVYLGHQGIRDTERYLHLPVFLYRKILDNSSKLLNNIIPEVTDEESL